MDSDALRATQKPLKDTYRENPGQAIVTLTADGQLGAEEISCSVATGKALTVAGLHPASGGDGSLACSGDMLLQALVACAGVTLRAVATSLQIPVSAGTVYAEGDLDFRGTLAVGKDAPVGFTAIRLGFELDTDASAEQLETLLRLTERYCVVFQTVARPVSVTASVIRGRSVRFVQLSSAVMTALIGGDLRAASAEAGVELTEYFLADHARRLWRRRVDQIAADPASAGWVARAVLAEPEGVVVGHAGFHGPPDEAGLVEVGYSVDPGYRRRGYARAMLRELLRRAATEPGVKTVRAAISPDNTASLATIAGLGFTAGGEQWDEEDGRELIFDRPAGKPPG